MSAADPTLEELRILHALQCITSFYLGVNFDGCGVYMAHGFMSDGEHALDVLIVYGAAERVRGGGLLTERGKYLESLCEIDDDNFENVKARFLSLPSVGIEPSASFSREKSLYAVNSPRSGGFGQSIYRRQGPLGCIGLGILIFTGIYMLVHSILRFLM